ncbi:hypothetical protein Pan216_39860 [Planctomycetes bacterium Pan216]|uniref:3-keto-alpha-glucoside-1,2-lyase/3-keto-2-hydroxy-glucal hydratase domain-containing protein n=1 Tax=Kolteria novifilia TaxID=2527975 RepID=A0A518B811_9BACT|nr:hypothetical protein Pan216_39860 [Planctomycetes bacterium Pan216]
METTTMHRPLVLAALMAMSTSVCLADAKQNVPPKGYSALFNGKDLSGWQGRPHFDPAKWAALSEDERAAKQKEFDEDMKKHWRVENGVLINDGKGVYLTTDKDYGNYELLIDWKMVPKGDSGVYLRGSPQVQIWDTTQEGGKWKIKADKGSGGLFNNKTAPSDPLVHADKPIGEWNNFRIKIVDDKVSVWLNDKLVVDDATMENYWDKDRKTPLYETGPIQLQTHGGEMQWKNIFLKPLPPTKS